VDTFYQKGDAISDKVSGFMRRLFGNAGQRNAAPYQSQPSGAYQQPGPYQQSRPAYTQPSYQQPSYTPPSYQQPTYTQPSYQQPSRARTFINNLFQRKPVASNNYQAQPPPISNYEQPVATSSVYGYSTPSTTSPAPSYSTPPSNQRSTVVAPAKRTTKSTTRKPLLSLTQKSPKPIDTVPANPSGFYSPPQIVADPSPNTQPPTRPINAKAGTSTGGVYEPGTIVNTSPAQPKEMTQTPKLEQPAPKEPEPTKPKQNEPTAPQDDTPMGTKGSRPGRAKSPYPPYNELDVGGLESGSMALDPTTNKVFRVP
jgi:hypothetical protein